MTYFLRTARWLTLAGMFFVAAAFTLPASESEASLLLSDHPIILGESDFIKRIETPLSGRDEPLGLLLSGGSARAFAHIGVLKRLEEAGYAPDFIVTNSMGSIVGLLYGAGFSPDAILSLFQTFEPSSLFEPEIPLRGGILNPGNFIELIEELVPYRDLSELPIPVLVVCEDLRTKRRVVLAEGNFSTVLAASFALPFYFPPQNLVNLRLIDGGVTNLAPMEVPYTYSDTVLVSTTFYQKQLNLSNPVTNLNVAMDIGKSRRAVSSIKQFDPIWIRCNVEKFSFMDWNFIEEIATRGYESASRTLLSAQGRLEGIPSVDPIYLTETRETARRRAARETAQYHRTGMVHVEPALTGARIGIQLADGQYDQPLFGDRNRFTAGAYLKYGNFDANLKLMYQPGYLNRYQMVQEDFTGTALNIIWMPGRLIRFTVFNDLNYSFEENRSIPLDLHSTHSSGELFMPFRLGVDIIGGPAAGAELSTDDELSPENYCYYGGLRAYSKRPEGFIRNFETHITTNQADQIALQAEIAVNQKLVGPLRLNQRLFTRLPVAHSEQVTYHPADYYTPLKSPEQVDRLIIANTKALLSFPRFQPTFGETLLMEQFSIGPFFDLRETGQGSLNYAVGGGLQTALSLLGLKPISMRMDAGWSVDSEQWFFSFVLWS